MSGSEPSYTVRQTAELAGITVRTLHHYHQIGLLNPSERNAAGYRLYGRDQLLRLQQILFYREMDMSLAEIRSILSDPGFDGVGALQEHRRVLTARAERLTTLIATIDRTIGKIQGGSHMLSDKDLYDGFSREEAEQYKAEAQDRWPQEFAATDARIRKMGKPQWQAVKKEGETITQLLAQAMDNEPTSADVQGLVERHHAWIENFYPADAERYRGLAQMYVTDSRFAAHYDAAAPGLANFLCAAMNHYASTRLA